MKPKQVGAAGRAKRRQILLMVLLMGFLGGTSAFLFFLESKTAKMSQQISQITDNSDKIIDDIITEVSNCAALEFPFAGAADHCWYRDSTGVALVPSVDLRGFLLVEGALVHVIRNAAGGTDLVPFKGITGPLLSGLTRFEFVRSGPRLLRLSMALRPAEGSGEPIEVRRSILLKNH